MYVDVSIIITPLLLQIWAHPADINILPEYGRDPRTVGELMHSHIDIFIVCMYVHCADNLLDGVNHTCDDLHAWLTPFTSGQEHLIWVGNTVCMYASMYFCMYICMYE